MSSRTLVYVFREKQILRACLRGHVHAVLPGPADLVEPHTGTQVDDVNAGPREPGQPGHGSDRRGFAEIGPRKGKGGHLRLVPGAHFREDRPDEAFVLRVDEGDAVKRRDRVERPKQRPGLRAPSGRLVRREELEAPDAHFRSLANLSGAFRVPPDDFGVQRVINHGAGRIRKTFPDILRQRGFRAADGEVDDGSDPAAGRCNRSGLEIVARAMFADRQGHMGMRVDARGEDEQSLRVDLPLPFESCAKRRDAAVGHCDVGFKNRITRYDCSSANDEIVHGNPPSSRQKGRRPSPPSQRFKTFRLSCSNTSA